MPAQFNRFLRGFPSSLNLLHSFSQRAGVRASFQGIPLDFLFIRFLGFVVQFLRFRAPSARRGPRQQPKLGILKMTKETSFLEVCVVLFVTDQMYLRETSFL